MIEAVIFDLGHTLWDIERADRGALDRAYVEMRDVLAARLGGDDLPPATVLRTAVTAALEAEADTYFTNSSVLEQPATHVWVQKGLRSLGLELDEALLREITPPLFATEIDRLVVQEGTLEGVLALHEAGIKLGCVTNTLADASAIHAMLRNHGFFDVMGAIIVSSGEGYRKPHSSLFEKAMRELCVSASECVFVGDSPYHDIGGAKALGMGAVLTRQYATRPPVPGVPDADAVIVHVRELPAIVERWGDARA
jgi:HAD superfamily hydrolase (TIGR01662 family)